MIRFFLFAFLLSFLTACKNDEASTDLQEKEKVDEPIVAKSPSDMLMFAEYAYQNQRYDLAAKYYYDLAGLTQNVEVFKRGIGLALKAEKLEEASSLAERWKEVEPDSIESLQYRLIIAVKKGVYDSAALVFRELVEKREGFGGFTGLDISVALLEREATPEQELKTLQAYAQLSDFNPESLYYLGSIAMREKAYDIVIEAAEKAQLTMKDEEQKHKLRLMQVRALTQLKREEEALVVLNKLVVEAADTKTKQEYARLLSSLKQTDKAIALLDEVFVGSPDNASVLLDMMSIQLDANRYEEALSTIDKLEKLDPKGVSANYFRGLVYEAKEDFPEALKAYKAIKSPQADAMDVKVRLSTVLYKIKGLDAIVEYIDTEISAAKDAKQRQKELFSLRAHFQNEEKHYQASLDSLDEALALLPDDDLVYQKAILYEKLKDFPSSEKTFLSLLDKDENNATVLNALGYMLVVNTTRYDDAEKYLKKALSLEPNDPAIIDSVGWLHYRQGDLDKAEAMIRQAYAEIQDPEVASHLIEILAKVGKKKEAAQIFQEMLKKHPDNELLLKVQSVL